MKSLKLILMGSVSSIFLSSNIYSNNISYLYDVLPESARGDFELSFSKAEFNENLYVLGYMDNLTGARPKQADITELSLSYRVFDKYRLTLQTNDSFAEVTRSGIPSSVETEAKTDFISFSFPQTLITKFAKSIKLIGSRLLPIFIVSLFVELKSNASAVPLAVSSEKL